MAALTGEEALAVALKRGGGGGGGGGGGDVSGVKGDVESSYRKNNVNLTLQNITNLGDGLEYDSTTKTLKATIQYPTMPAPVEALEDKIAQYIGDTTADYINGHFYQCIEDPDTAGTYLWTEKEVQSGQSISYDMIADEFDDTVDYSTGDVVIYEGDLYEFNTDHTAGAWDAAEADKRTVGGLYVGIAEAMPTIMDQDDVDEIKGSVNIKPYEKPQVMTSTDVQEIKDAFAMPTVYPFTIGIGGGYAPVGTIISYMGTTAPQDYLACDGTVYNIADYKQLARHINDHFGSVNFFGGDGTTTFAVPDLRGEFLRGTGTNGHANQGNGEDVGVHQDATKTGLPTLDGVGNRIIYYGNSSRNWDSPTSSDVGFSTANKYLIAKVTGEAIGGSGVGVGLHTLRPTNTSILYCIKAIAAGEVYSTEERVVGTWIDGKPIYQKTFTATVTARPQSIMLSTDLKRANATMRYGYGVKYVGSSGDDNDIVFPYYTINSAYINLYQSTTGLMLDVGANIGCELVCTVGYTKTTD